MDPDKPQYSFCLESGFGSFNQNSQTVLDISQIEIGQSSKFSKDELIP